MAILSKFPLEDVTPRLPGGDGDDHALLSRSGCDGGQGRGQDRLSVRAPNGNPIGTEKFSYKLAWLERLHRHAAELAAGNEEPWVALLGDYNIIPEEKDCHDPKAWAGDALFQPQSRAGHCAPSNISVSTDAFRAGNQASGQYTFWDYQAGSWRRNNGIRIDHILLSPQAADRLVRCEIDREVREGDKPSDHVPIWCDLDI